MDKDKELLKYIRNRTRAENMRISLKNLLKHYNMETYFHSCSERILNTDVVDGKHIQIDFVNFPNLLLDNEGVINCFDILNGYVNEIELSRIYKNLIINNGVTKCINDQLDILRKSSVKDLIEFGFCMFKFKEELEKKKFDDGFIKRFSKMNRAEFFSRTSFNKARIWIIKKAIHIYINIRYWHIFSILKKCEKDNTQTML